MPTVARSYAGHCKLRFAIGIELDADFNLQLRSDGQIHVSVSLPMTQNAFTIMKEDNESKGLLSCALTGTVSEPEGKITIPTLLLNTTNLGSSTEGTSATFGLICTSTAHIEYASIHPQETLEVHYGLTNFDFLGCEYTRDGNTISADKFRANLEGVELVFKQVKNHQTIISQLKMNHDVQVTAEATATITFSQLEQLEHIVGDAAILLSYATGTYVSWIYRDVYSSSTLVRSSLYDSKTGPYVHRDCVIDSYNLEACDLRIFLEASYPAFNSLKDDLGLNTVLEFLVVANQGRYLELTFLLDSVAAECLLSYLSSYFTKIGKTADLSSFRSKMRELLNHFGVVYKESELDFIGTRDKIVHTGRFPAGVDAGGATTKLHNLMDRSILTMLGYRGKFYLNRANSYAREAL